MPIPLAYKTTRLTGENDDAPLIIREATMLEPVDPVPYGPRVQIFKMMNPTARGHIVAMIAEFIGTMMFLFFAYAAAQIGNEKTDTLRPFGQEAGLSLLQIIYISAAFAVSLGVQVWIFYRVSGGMFNPAVRVFLDLYGRRVSRT